MTLEQLQMMEDQLHVALPGAYRQVLLAFPWPVFASGTEFSLWDDAALNVERTFQSRDGYRGAPPCPADHVHIDDDACPYALRCSDGTIVKTDHGNLTARPLASFASAEVFVKELQETLRHDGSPGLQRPPCQRPNSPMSVFSRIAATPD